MSPTACVPPQEKPLQWDPSSLQREKARLQQPRPAQSKLDRSIKHFKKKKTTKTHCRILKMIYMDSFKGYNLNREELFIMFREKSVPGLEKSRPLPAYCATYVPDCYCIYLWPLQKNNHHRQRKPGLIFFFSTQLYSQLLNSTWHIFVFSLRFLCCWEPKW